MKTETPNDCVPRPPAIRDTLITEIGDLTVEFSPRETRISLGKNALAVPRNTWPRVIAKSAVYDAVLSGSPIPAPNAPAIIPAGHPGTGTPELGAEIGGGFCGGRHPEIEGAVLIFSEDLGSARWVEAMDRIAAHRGGGYDDWRPLTRIELLILFKRFGQRRTAAQGFREGEDNAFPESGHWSGEEYEFASFGAWGQTFGNGGSHPWSKGLGLRVRAGRALFI